MLHYCACFCNVSAETRGCGLWLLLANFACWRVFLWALHACPGLRLTRATACANARALQTSPVGTHCATCPVWAGASPDSRTLRACVDARALLLSARGRAWQQP